MDQRRAYEGYREAELGREKFIFGREFPRAVVTHSNLSVIGPACDDGSPQKEMIIRGPNVSYPKHLLSLKVRRSRGTKVRPD
jgi:hypothetical protein